MPSPFRDYGALIQSTAQKYGVDPELVKSVIQVESGGNPTAASGTGPVGLMQVSKALAKDYGYSPEDRLDPAKNIEMGTRYLAQNLKAFGGNPTKALLGYNQGTGGASQMLSGKIPLAAEGKNYVNNPAFQKFTTGQIPATLQSVANPVAALQNNKPDNQFSPALLQRDVAAAAPNQADVMAAQAQPAPRPLPAGYNPDEEENRDHWGNAALALASMFAPKQSHDSSVVSGVGRAGTSGWNPQTRHVMQVLNQVSSAPNFSGGVR